MGMRGTFLRDPGAHGGGSSYPAGPERSGSLSGTPCSTGAAGRRIPVCDRRARWALPVGGGGLDAQTRSGTSLQGAAVIPPFTGSAELPSPFPSALRTVADHGRRCAGRSLPGEGRTLRAIATTGGSGEGCIPAAGQVSIRVAGSFSMFLHEVGDLAYDTGPKSPSCRLIAPEGESTPQPPPPLLLRRFPRGVDRG